MPINVAIIGASGYTGAELIRLLFAHPNIKIQVLTGDSSAGQSLSTIYPHLQGLGLPALIKLDDVSWKDIDAAFFCLPHGTSQEAIAKVPEHVRIIDLSADFRLFHLPDYEHWYGHPHQAPELQKTAVYALTELCRDDIKKTRLVANPGCYPTSALLPLIPLIQAGAIDTARIIIDAKSGISGAGRSAKVANLFTEMNENLKPYSIANHRHTSEIEQALNKAAGKSDIKVTFTPQVVPVSRGMLSTIYVSLKKPFAEAKAALQKRYQNEAFVQVLEGGTIPTMRDVAGTNRCWMNIFEDRVGAQAIIVSAIDNLVKGASGQAVQNFNLIFGLEETTGLNLLPVFP